ATAIDARRCVRIDIDGRPVQMVVSPFKHRRNLDWLVVMVVPEADFMGGVYRSRMQGAVIGAAAVAAALLAGVLLAMWLMRPILAVVEHAQRVGEGDLDARLDRHDNKEIAQLSTAL